MSRGRARPQDEVLPPKCRTGRSCPTNQGNVSGMIEPATLACLADFRECRFENRKSMCPYKRPYNSGATRIRLLPLPSVVGSLTCGEPPVGYRPAPSFPAHFRIPKPCAKVRILPGAQVGLYSRLWSLGGSRTWRQEIDTKTTHAARRVSRSNMMAALTVS